MQWAFGESPFSTGPWTKGIPVPTSLLEFGQCEFLAGSGARAASSLPPARPTQTRSSASCTQQAGLGFAAPPGPGVRVQSRASGPRAPVPFQITLYEGTHFTGRKLEVFGDCDNFQDRGFLNRVNSIRVESGAWVCFDHPDFRGQQFVLERGEYPDFFRWNGHNDHVGSCRPVGMVSGPRRQGASRQGAEGQAWPAMRGRGSVHMPRRWPRAPVTPARGQGVPGPPSWTVPCLYFQAYLRKALQISFPCY